MILKVNYECPRCGYKTLHQASMIYHLYKRKKPCKMLCKNLDLTNAIKDQIIKNKVYIPPDRSDHNIIASQIASLKTYQMIDVYNNNRHLTKPDLDDIFNDTYASLVDNLDNDRLSHYKLDQDNLIEQFNKVINTSEAILYEEDEIAIYSVDHWDQYSFNSGLELFIQKAMDYFLGSYECYLSRKYIHGSVFDRANCKLFISIYYRFLIATGIPPYINGKDDMSITGKHGYTAHDEVFKIYLDTKRTITKSEIKEIRKSLKTTLTHKTKSIRKSYYNHLMTMADTDTGFRKYIKDLSS